MARCKDTVCPSDPDFTGDAQAKANAGGEATRSLASQASGFEAQTALFRPVQKAPPKRNDPTELYVPPWAQDDAGASRQNYTPVAGGPRPKSGGQGQADQGEWPQPMLDAPMKCGVDPATDPAWILESAIDCVNDVGQNVMAMLDEVQYQTDAETLMRLEAKARAYLRAIEHSIWVQDGAGRGPRASGGTLLLATVVGPNTLGPHLRPEAREGIRAAVVGRLAAATAVMSGAAVLDERYTRGIFSDLIDDIFADVRGVSRRDAPTDQVNKSASRAGDRDVGTQDESSTHAKDVPAVGSDGKKPPKRSLLNHLSDEENTAKSIDPAFRKALDGAPAPARETRLPSTLAQVYDARPSLYELFFEGTSVGKSLNSDLTQIRHVSGSGQGAVERGFDPKQGGGYYRLIREQVKGPLDATVRRPTMVDSVLRTPTPRLPEPVKGSIRQWLAKTPLPDRTLPPSVRMQIRDVLGSMTLEAIEVGDMLHVMLHSDVRKKVFAILGAATINDPGRVAVYAWWTKHIDQPERHHIWPKWLLGDEAQVGMMLPRCIHNMAGVGLDDGGFHQVLNALFAQDVRFANLRPEDSEGFRRLFQAAKTPSDKRKLILAVRSTLVRAYRETLGNQFSLVLIRTKLAEEVDRISQETPK